MVRLLCAALLALLLCFGVAARVQPFPATFRVMDIKTDGATIHVRVGGSGPAVLLLHGFGDSGDMWEPLAAVLVAGHTVVVPDLRGMGLSSHPDGGYDKKTEARDMLQRFVATDVTPLVIPGAGHWLMEEQPVQTVTAITAFLKG